MVGGVQQDSQRKRDKEQQSIGILQNGPQPTTTMQHEKKHKEQGRVRSCGADLALLVGSWVGLKRNTKRGMYKTGHVRNGRGAERASSNINAAAGAFNQSGNTL